MANSSMASQINKDNGDSSGSDTDNYVLRAFMGMESDSDDEREATTSSTSSSTSRDEDNIPEDSKDSSELSVISNIKIIQRKKDGIASQLWPAATFLAEFVLQEIEDSFPTTDEKTDVTTAKLSSLTTKEEVGAIPQEINPKTEIKTDPSILKNYNSFKHKFYTLLTSTNNTTPPSKCTSTFNLRTIELGSGIGLTSIKIAKEINKSKFKPYCILTDLPCALPLMAENVNVNFPINTKDNEWCKVMPLAWGTDDHVEVLEDCLKVRGGYISLDGNNENDKVRPCKNNEDPPFHLILAADCVYWSELHQPLKSTLLNLLIGNPKSQCLIAGVRRWKKDNDFYKSINKVKSLTPKGKLSCECIMEKIDRVGRSDGGLGMGVEDAIEREIIRVYFVTWIPL